MEGMVSLSQHSPQSQHIVAKEHSGARSASQKRGKQRKIVSGRHEELNSKKLPL